MLPTEKMNTRHSAETLIALVKANPCRMLDSGDVVLPPMRLSFPNLAKEGPPAKNAPPGSKGKFGTNLLAVPGMTPDAGLQVLRDQRFRKLAEAFPQNPRGLGMKEIFKNQGQQVAPAEGGTNVSGKTYSGHVPDAYFISATSQRRPTLFVPPMVNGVPTLFLEGEEAIENTFYAGAWVIPVVNVYVSKVNENKGAFIGLQSLLKVLDDNKLAGGGGAPVDARAAYGGISLPAEGPGSLF